LNTLFQHTLKISLGCFTLLCVLIASGCSTTNEKAKPVEEVIPLTMANIKGHKTLYNEGWFVVSSTEEALEYAKQKSIVSSADVLKELRTDVANNTVDYGSALKKGLYKGVSTTQHTFVSGTDNTKIIVNGTTKLVAAEIAFTKGTLVKGAERFWLGYAHLDQRTENDREELVNIPGNYFKTLSQDFSNMNELTDEFNESITPNIRGDWSRAFQEARDEFNQSYEDSGKRSNTLTGLFDILKGYGKAIYTGLLSPTGRSTVQGATGTARMANEYIFLPTAKVFIVTGRTVESLGLSLYYTTTIGYKIVSPTVEGGLLTSLAIVSAPAAPVTAVAGGTVGAINQVAVTAASPVVGTTHTVVDTTTETVKYAAQMSYDLLSGTSKVVLNQLSSGVVLGYNALTALPTQALLATTNTIFFLAWDGPRLVIASAKGQVSLDDEGNQLPVDALPVGSIVDLEKLRQQKGVDVEVVSDDPKVIEQVLERSTEDMRELGKK